MEQKFLDKEGIKYLWSQISLEDYPNNETLVAVLNAIDTTKADKNEVVLTTPQSLTEAQKHQVKENLGLTTVQEPENTDPVTTEYVYSYDGDKDSDTNQWCLIMVELEYLLNLETFPKVN